jgi:CRP-like cAMP-binding protein
MDISNLEPEWAAKKHLAKGEVWNARLDLTHSVVTLLAGILSFNVVDGQGNETVVCFCGPGKLFHLPPHVLTLPQSDQYHFRALGDTVLGYAPLDQTATASLANSFFSQLLTQDFLELSEHLASLHSQDARTRYERLIAQQPEVLKLATNAELAAYLHTSRETISRIRKKLAVGGSL